MTYKKGDKVVMSDCFEAEHYEGKVWTCSGDSFQDSSGEEVVYLDDKSSYFSCDCLTSKKKVSEHERRNHHQ